MLTATQSPALFQSASVVNFQVRRSPFAVRRFLSVTQLLASDLQSPRSPSLLIIFLSSISPSLLCRRSISSQSISKNLLTERDRGQYQIYSDQIGAYAAPLSLPAWLCDIRTRH